MADDKKSKNDKLYDHSSSKKGDGEKNPAAKSEDKKPAASAEASKAKPEVDKSDAKPEAKGETKAEPAAKSMAEKHAEERESLFKAQRGERRDLHGNHRSEHDQMNARQEEAIKAVVDKHLAEIAAESAAGAAAAPGAGGGEPPAGGAAMAAAPAPAVA